MIIGVDFFGKGWEGNIYDTAIPTSELDEVTMNTGIYDELYVSVDTTIDDKNEKPTGWKIKNIIDAKFNNSLEAGTIDGSGHTVTDIQLYRREYQTDMEWQLVAAFPYDPDYNVYTIVDRFIQNQQVYEYCIVPIAEAIVGDVTVSQPVKSEFDGVYISDIENNFKMEADLEIGETDYHKNFSQSVPLNGAFPIVSFGSQNYRTGNVKFLPLTEEQLNAYGTKIDGRKERLNRQRVIEFLNNGQAKVIRREDGDMIVCSTTDIKASPKGGGLNELSGLSFNYIELGKLDVETMEKSGLIARAGKSLYTYDDFGEIVWSNQRVNDGARRKYRNSFAEGE